MANETDIAVVGMALRVPGAVTPEEFWKNLQAGKESLQTYSDEQLRERGVPSSLLADPNYVRSGMPLAAFDEFDPEFFGFSQKEAAILDPQHRQFYEVAWEALERAGCVPDRFSGAIGVFAGCGMGAYFAQNILRNADLLRSVGLFLLRHTGNDKDFLATRVSYAFDLKGPSVNVQTACSTSLVAAHLAIQSLLGHETDIALAGGVTIEIPNAVGYVYQDGEILAPDGHCRPFDHQAKGTVFGSGCGVVVLRRLADALKDGDHIHAVIKASAVNNDGASKVGYLAPSVEGQAAAISEAISLAGIESSSIGLVECHGTGTPMGDPIEVAALTQAFRESSDAVGHCLIGSVKSNIGHLDTAAGVVGLIKAVMALENATIPPSINFESNNPSIAFDGSPFKVASRLTSWPGGGSPRRAAVNSLGVGGTNAFVVLEEAPKRTTDAQGEGRPEAIVLSARNRKALDDYSVRLATWMRENPSIPLRQIATSLGQGRRLFEQRRVLSATTTAEAAEMLERGDPKRVFTHTQETERPSMVFMFPGGGAQYAGMGRSLYESEPRFRTAMDQGLDLLRNRFGVDLRSVFLTQEKGSAELDAALNRPSVQLPLVFLIEMALVDLWADYGVKPAALIGHSMGENTAACVAGVLSRKDALGLVLLRGQLMDNVPDGGMLSVPLAAKELRELLGPDLDLAAANSPMLSIASGPSAALDELSGRLSARGLESRRVRINIAAHSRMLDGILERFRAYLAGVKLNPPSIPIVSNFTGSWLQASDATSPDYWVRHLRNTVNFSGGATLLLEGEGRVFLEAGPGSILGSFVRQSHGAPAQRIFSSLRHPEDPVSDGVYFKTVLGRILAVGELVSRESLWPNKTPRIPLPTYSFQHSRYWIDPSAPDSIQDDDQALLPERTQSQDDWLFGPRWVQQGILETDEDIPRTWCVFHDQDPLIEGCIQWLRESGHRVIEVISGDTMARVGEHKFTLAPESGGGVYQELIDELSALDLLPDRVLHSWLITRTESFRAGKTFLHHNQERGIYSLFYLARAFAKRAEGKTAHWIVLGNGAVSVSGEALPYPDKALVLGACGVIPRELPGVTCAYVDVVVSAGSDNSRLLHGLKEELAAPPETSVIAWRDRVRWTRYIAPHQSKASGKAIPVRERGVYLITGGFGGIAGILGDWLAHEHKARLVLLSRTPLPPRSDWVRWLSEHQETDSISRAIRRVTELEAMGAEVLPLAADISVAEQVQDALEATIAKFGSLHGVFHTAGVLRDGLISLKSERDIEDVFAAKVYGTLVLDQACRDIALDFMCLFSSVSSYVAPVGQIDYTAANSFLNAFAESRTGKSRYPVVAINWGIWKGAGMAASPVGGSAQTDQFALEIARSKEVEARYPLFRARHVSGEGASQVHWLIGRIGASDWLAGEHRLLRGDSLVPATGYIELIRAAFDEIGCAPHSLEIAALTFLQPFYVPEGGPRDFRIRLRGSAGRWRIDLFASPDDNAPEMWQLIATARAIPAGKPKQVSVDIPQLQDRCIQWKEIASGDSSFRTRQEAHLKFGPRWHVLRGLQFGRGEALATIRLNQDLAADLDTYRIHPGLLDIATGCAMDLIPGYREQDTPENLWVPVSYGSYRQFSPMPVAFHSWVRISDESSTKAGSATFSVTLVDDEGRVFAEVDGLQVRRIIGELPRAGKAVATASIEGSTGRSRAEGPAERALAHNLARGISDAEGMEVMRRILACVDRAVVIASSIRPRDLLRQADAVARVGNTSSDVRFARPKLETGFEAPRDDVERHLSDLWGKLLGVEGVGIRDSFFELGGHSLVAVRLFNEVSDRYGVDLPLSALMQHPDIASLSERIRGGPVGEETANRPAKTDVGNTTSFRHLVPMHSGPVGAGTPIFIVAGMFGNVLNLGHLAHLLDQDRPFFALQARGLLGDVSPHESFEEMARDYLEEVRTVQPNGPYLLGGFSGGGLVAYEMARQLLASGEKVGAVVLLDTPIRENNQLSYFNKVEMLVSRLRAEGLGFIARKLEERREWKREVQAREAAKTTEAAASGRFHSMRIGDAFLRALASYRISPADVHVTLFRPRLKVKHRLRDGRMLSADRSILLPDNGWTKYVSGIEVIEVPGSHDDMVLEPNVRVLAAGIRRVLS